MKRKITLLLFSMLVAVFSMQAQNSITGDSDIGSPTQFASSGNYNCMASSGDYLYAGLAGKIEVWDKSDPANPTIASSFDVTTASNIFYHFFIDGTTLYASARYTNKLWIIDISDPSNLSVINSVAIPDFPIASYVEGNYAYVATDNNRSLEVVDLNTLTIVASMPLASEYGSCVVKNANYLYVGTSASLYTFDVTDPTNPTQLSKQSLTAGAYDFELIGDYLYIAEESGNLQTFSVATPNAPSLENSTTISTGKTVFDLDYDGKYLFTGTNAQPSSIGAITVFDLSIPNNPSVIAQSGAQNAQIRDITVQNGYIFGISSYGTLGLFSYTLSKEIIPPGNALDFDGVDDYVNLVGGSAIISNLSTFTFECWIKMPTTPKWMAIFKTQGVAGSGLAIANTGIIQLRDNTNTGSFQSNSGVIDFDGQWHHIAISNNGSAGSGVIYVDGQPVSLNTNGFLHFDNTTNDLYIGNWLNSDYIHAQLDEVRFWDIARTQCEIQQAMNTELNGDETGLVAYYNFNQGAAGGSNSGITTLTDKIGTYNGTLTNFALTGSTSNWLASTANISGTANFVDNFAPVPDVTTLSDVTAECSVTPTAPTATDACAGTITGTTTTTFPITAQGTTVVTWTYDDGNGNTSTQDQNVVITDVTDPTITCIENQTINLTGSETAYTVVGNEFDPTADDNCEVASVTNDLNSNATLDGEQIPIGTKTIVWTVTDGAGNEATCSFDIVVNAPNSIQNVDNSEVNIYPNPSTGIFIFETTKKYDVTVTDITGKVVLQSKVYNNMLVDLSNNADGVYFIKFQNNETVKTVKIIKE